MQRRWMCMFPLSRTDGIYRVHWLEEYGAGSSFKRYDLYVLWVEGQYYVHKYASPQNKMLAGPFDSLDAARAAYILLMDDAQWLSQ